MDNRFYWPLLCFLCWTALFQIPTEAFGGAEAVRVSDTVRLTVDSRWPGNSQGGYVPLRISLQNLGPEQDFQLVFKSERSGSLDRIPEVRRTVHLVQNDNRNLTLPIPMVSRGSSGQLLVLDGRGKEIEELRTAHSLADFGGENARASLLVIASDELDDKQLQPFEDAASTESMSIATARGTMGYGGSRGSGHIAETDHLIIPPRNLPENWTDYSGIDLIAISWLNLSSKLETTEREALLKWAACGGVLIIYGTEKSAAELDPLRQLLQLDASSGKRWTPIDISVVDTIIIDAASGPTGRGAGSMPRAIPRPPAGAAGQHIPKPPEQPVKPKSKSIWQSTSNIPTYRDWSFGRIYVFPKSPFPGAANDWAWFLVSLPQNQSRWSSRLGISSRTSGLEFLNFLIPGVGSVPVHAFLVLITIFTIVIGPLNYYWLRKNRRVGALVFTVPLIASIACLMLFCYSVVADGFSARSRLHSVTFLDQQAKSAASISRLCLYAPFAPSTGLKFSPNVAAFPIWSQQQRFEGGTVDWTGNEQKLTSGWFRSQTWTQFLLVEQRDERGRLDFTPPADPMAEELTISNGFSWDLEYLAIESSPGNWYAGEKIPAGGAAQLKRLEVEEIGQSFTKYYDPVAWNSPAGLDESNLNQYGTQSGRGGASGHTYPYGRSGGANGMTSLTDGLLRNYQNGAIVPGKSPAILQRDWRNGVFQSQSRRHTETNRPHYWAVCGQNPGIEMGVQGTIETSSYHLIFGVF